MSAVPRKRTAHKWVKKFQITSSMQAKNKIKKTCGGFFFFFSVALFTCTSTQLVGKSTTRNSDICQDQQVFFVYVLPVETAK